MRKLWRKRWFRLAAYAAGVLLVAALSACAYFRIYGPKDILAYREMWKECHPIWKDLAFRRVCTGDAVEGLHRLGMPSENWRHGPYVVSNYYDRDLSEGGIPFTGVSVISKDDRLVTAVAWSCCWQHTFFGDSEKTWIEIWKHPSELLKKP